MTHRMICWVVSFVLCIGGGSLARAAGEGAGATDSSVSTRSEATPAGPCPHCEPGTAQPDLFYNYYVPPGCGGVGAQLYVAPGPVPAWVGHTYVTYQPLMPHEFLYTHHHTYYRYYDCGRGMTRVKTVYYYPPIRTWTGHLVDHLRIPR